MEEMTQAEYAKHRGVARVSVTRWKYKGLLVFTESGKIDVRQTDEKLNHKSNKQNEDIRKDIIRKEKNVEHPEKLKALLGDQMMSKHQAETLKENYLAKLRKLEYEKKAGNVVEVEPLKKILFELWRQERDALLNLPSRIGAVIAAELGIDQNRLVILLEKSIHEFLAERADQPRITIGKSM